ncbi:hypothetical protein I79_005424 [Cricetulus griseus]|uniref:Uncharacterized protein n=1 Tax=Cricetulus griseus TaxID=10029 RepID=G3H553_CRIGR|nr:hypothetical protein I79_005424 [Cricetulus griseus]
MRPHWPQLLNHLSTETQVKHKTHRYLNRGHGCLLQQQLSRQPWWSMEEDDDGTVPQELCPYGGPVSQDKTGEQILGQ